MHKKHHDIQKFLQGENDFLGREIKRITIEGDAFWRSNNKTENPMVRRKLNASSKTLDETGSSQAVSIHEYYTYQRCQKR